MRRQFSHLMLKSGVLYRSMQLEDEIVEHLIIPESCRIEVLRGLHNDMGHPGRDGSVIIGLECSLMLQSGWTNVTGVFAENVRHIELLW